MRDATSEPGGTPLFLFGHHRGGTTYVQRLLNCHRRVVIWGENGGLLSTLRQGFIGFARSAEKVDTESYSEFKDFAAEFIPWVSPVDGADLRLAIARFVEELYCTDHSAKFWGFKEIRHINRADINFLRLLFPTSRIVLLFRHPKHILTSMLHVRWSEMSEGSEHTEPVRNFLASYISAVSAALEARLRRPDLVRLCRYEDMCEEVGLHDLLNWLCLDPKETERNMVKKVHEGRAGSSFADVGRVVAPHVVDSVADVFAREVASALVETQEPVRTTVLDWYPDLYS